MLIMSSYKDGREGLEGDLDPAPTPMPLGATTHEIEQDGLEAFVAPEVA